uniref:Uncharacterized protein n=1 Tax=Panagrolaimus sp. JU765 TaxID=591449 RepID=A0AC34QHI9_9BILA
MSNVTMLKSLVSMESNFSAKQHSFKNLKSSKKQSDYKLFIANETSTMAIYQYDFWESFLIFPMLAVLCIILILILSFIFFGRREGQHWRDYKTPREQLQEYLILRESQKRLRELSVQRQILLMSNERKTSTPVGIRTFLQPNSLDEEVPSPEITVYGSSKDYANHSPFTNTAKQTVADAVKATGSSLRLYKNPTADSEDENDEEKVAHKKHHRKSNS